MYQNFAFAAHADEVVSHLGLSLTPFERNTTTRLFGLDLLDGARVDTARMLVARAALRLDTQVSFVNAHGINVAAKDRSYRQALQGCDYRLPDGSGLRIAAGLAGTRFGENLNGTDLFPLICEEAAMCGVSIFLLGGMPGVAADAAAEMERRYPGLRVAGTRDGYFEHRQTGEVIAEINASGADMLFVGFGVPLQECWLADHGVTIAAPVQLAVGGLFDYYSGRIPRAPQWMRRAGCEWIWRLAQEPKRLAGRYLLGNAAFLLRAVDHAIEQRGLAPQGSAKRAFDIAASFAGLCLLAPLFLAIALAIAIEDRGPVFFRQTRIGKNGKPFRMIKFRSMVVDAERIRKQIEAMSERDGVCFKMRKDPRITRVGAWLRRTSIDELPQLINVLTGDMSLVGPRPALPKEVTAYWDRALQRLDVKPGITCIWQVSGRAEIPFDQQVEMDIDYVEDHGLARDLWLLLRTVPAVATGRGAY
jgi:exopolysaccharide biosynthesis WecB/TagA/CpsF family protein